MFENNKLKVAVIGIGRVGLPLALILADRGFNVYGIGRSKDKIDEINKGRMPFMERGSVTLLKKVLKKSFIAETDYSVIKDSDYIILSLGTPIDENMNPVYDQIDDALDSMTEFLKPNQTLILRSTVAPGTTKYVVSRMEDLGFKVGKNFFIAFCPERIAEGRALEEISTIPQIIGGIDNKSNEKADYLFKKIGVKTLISDDVSVELAKLFTNMYRYINFAIANEFMVLADHHKKDIYEIINLVNFGYTRGGLSSPGLTGGPCLFKDGFFLISDLPFNDLISTSWKINESIPIMLVKKVKEIMDLRHKKVTILGIAFKAEIDDIRESLSFKVRKSLLRDRADVVLHDPYVKDYRNQKVENDIYEASKNADLIFVGTNHAEYKRLDISKLKKVVNKDCMVCDVWNVFNTGKIIFPVKNLSNSKNKIK